MKPLRIAQHRPISPGGPVVAIRRPRRWLVSLVAAGLAALAVSGPVMLAAGPGGPSYVLTAAVGEQARVLNPGPPTGLTATAGDAQLSLSWTAPASDGGAAIIGYDVYLGTTSHGESATPAKTVGGTSATVTGLTNGTTYYVTVAAVNDADLHSAASAEASATPATTPGAPAGLTATAGDGQVSLSWTAPAATGGAQVTGYDVYAGTTADVKLGTPVATSAGTSVTVKKLANGTTYFFAVTAVNQVGQGPASGAASATPASAITQPGPPTGLTATPGHGQVALSWTAPASDGGAVITGYLVYAGTSPGGELAAPVNGTPADATSYTVTGLTAGTTYYFKVAAVNAAKHQGSDSGEVSARPVTATASPSATATVPASASAAPTSGAGAVASPTGVSSVTPAPKPALTARKVPKPVIISLAAVAVGATAGALTLGVWRLRPLRPGPRSRPPMAPPSDLRAVPDLGPPGRVTVHEVGADETYTVRLEPRPGAVITTVEEIRT